MDKWEALLQNLKKYKKLCIAYSGGVDSDFLLFAAQKALGNEVMAILCKGDMMAQRDCEEAELLLKQSGVHYEILDIDAFQAPEFTMNRKDRCYGCKKNIMGTILKKAKELGFDTVAHGQNRDDLMGYRPGAAAAKELGIVSPLEDAGFYKKDIRELANGLGLITWNKPSNSCLATRFPYEVQLTKELLKLAEAAENILRDLGIEGGRVRIHGDIARIELPVDKMSMFIEEKEAIAKLKLLGFRYVTLDLEGFRSGSMD